MFGSSSTSAATHVISVLFSEPKIPQYEVVWHVVVADEISVLFSEPKIPQIAGDARARLRQGRVSVLFSEPKIPQTSPICAASAATGCFSALQRAENSSN